MIRSATHVFIFMATATVALVLLFSAGAHADAPPGHYTVSGTGSAATVLDTKGNLRWQQASAPTAMTWANAKTYCAGIGATLGGTGWRLPTEKELLTLVDYSQTAAPFIDSTAFPGTPSAVFWSSTPVASSSSMAWNVDFQNDGFTENSDVTSGLDVRCVR